MGERSDTFLKTFINEDLAYDFMRRRNASVPCPGRRSE